jgi:Cdc6-like AAA superfamily ATPase
VREAFTPRTPIQLDDLFAGRDKEIERLFRAIEERSTHPIIFGERGVGKTSLANFAARVLERRGALVCKHACSSTSNFESIVRSLFQQIRLKGTDTGVGFEKKDEIIESSVANLLPSGPISVQAALGVLKPIRSTPVVLIVDEFDRIQDPAVRSSIADLIKGASDESIPVTVALVGVADDLTGLIGAHPSVERNILQVHLPLMSPAEIKKIAEQGGKYAGIEFADEVSNKIVQLSQGFPYYAHLLCLYSALNAVQNFRIKVIRDDLKQAVLASVEDADRSLREAYNLAIASSRETLFPDVLYAAARAKTNEVGTFSPTDMAAVTIAAGKQLSIYALYYPLSRLILPERGPILKRIGQPRRYRYKFANPMMRQFILLKQAEQRGLI